MNLALTDGDAMELHAPACEYAGRDLPPEETRGAGADAMTIWDQSKALFTLHRNRLNLLLHIISLPFLVLGLAGRRLSLIVVALLLEVVGHAYDYMRNFDEKQRSTARGVLPLQLVTSVVVLVLLFKLFR